MKIIRCETTFIDVPNRIALAVFTQGCSIMCPACQNKELWPFKGGFNFDESYIKKLIPNRTLCKYIVWLGGEPLDQSDFYQISSFIKQNYPLKQCLYSGYLYEQINEKIKENLDLIISGPYIGYNIQDKYTNKEIWIKDSNIWNKVENWDTLFKIMERSDN